MFIVIGLLNPVDNTAISGSDIGAVITFDGEEVVNTANLAAYALSNYTLANGAVITLIAYSVNGEIAIEIQYPNSNVSLVNSELSIDSIDIGVTITKPTFNTYQNTFKVFGYDTGNLIVAATLTNPNFVLYLVPTAETTIYPKFVAWRKPFSDSLYIYNASSSLGTRTYTTNINGSATLTTMVATNLQICSGLNTDIVQAIGSDTYSATIAERIWFPTFSFNLNCPTCSEDCISITDVNTVSLNIDFPISELYQTVDPYYAGRYYRIVYLLYNVDGNLVDFAYKGFEADNSSFTYNSSTYEWQFTPPAVGSYIIKVALSVFGTKDTPVINTGELKKSTWYLIVTADDGDYSSLGATFNTRGTAFFSTAVGTPNYGTGGVIELGYIQECYKKQIVKACNWFEITEDTTTCGLYTIKNNNLDIITYNLSLLQTDNSFLPIASQTLIEIAAGQSVTLTLSDGIYQLVIGRVVDDGITNVEELTQYIPVYCAVKACEKDKLIALMCKDSPCNCPAPCEDVCAANYDFNAFVILLHSYRLLIGKDYGLENGYNLVEIPNLSDLYTANDILTKLTEYCTTCDTNCL